jgi:hypothetical protein
VGLQVRRAQEVDHNVDVRDQVPAGFLGESWVAGSEAAYHVVLVGPNVALGVEPAVVVGEHKLVGYAELCEHGDG